MATIETFSDRLVKLREKTGKKRQEVADEIGISRASLEYYEKGKRKPDIEILAVLANYFKVSSDYLLGISNAESINEDIQFISKYTGLSESAINKLHEYVTPVASVFDTDKIDYEFTVIRCEEHKKFINSFIASTFFDSIIACERYIDDMNIDFISYLALFFGDYEYYYKLNLIIDDTEKLKSFGYLANKYKNDSIHGALNDNVDLAIFQLQKSMINRYETLSLLNALEDEQVTFDYIRFLVSNTIDKTIEENENIEFFDNQTKDLLDTDAFKDRTGHIEKLKEIYENFKKNKR